VEYPNAVNETTRLNAVKTGTADGTYISGVTYSSAVADPNLQIEKVTATSVFSIFMNNKIPPLDNPQVREAVSLALNRQTFNQDQNGLCPVVNQAFPPGMVGYSDSVTLQTDVAKAKSLIQSAGATGAKITILSIPNQPNAELVQIIQNQLDAVGLNIQIDTVAGTVFRTLYSQGGYGMLFAPSIGAGPVPDPSTVVNQYVLGSGNPGTKDPTLVAMIDQAERLGIGTPQRASAFQDINSYITTKAFLWAPICAPVFIYIANKKVLGLNAMPESEVSQSNNLSYLQIAK
jgi:peptide/nickel transport system substrate-binding protein